MIWNSGSTCVSVVIVGNKVYCANVGDSRAILISESNDEPGFTCKALSRDHKPDDEREAKRILENDGRIDTFKDHNGGPIGPQRVWLKNDDIPGLAMTRSFGDAVSMLAGVTAEPEVLECELTPLDKVMIIASDGVWEFISNEFVSLLF